MKSKLIFKPQLEVPLKKTPLVEKKKEDPEQIIDLPKFSSHTNKESDIQVLEPPNDSAIEDFKQKLNYSFYSENAVKLRHSTNIIDNTEIN